ncbi:hypothetical protein Har1130_15560 [Haloarcula sp. CBA1130]|uniref:hypothetical protein n=1 Tax=unclassified Haloarcula TaxID=2624677 RepID=UPI0012448B65|nr:MULTISPECIES: hypothetical protein [unclassified Haloarcula]KAA9395880.1 hypothetical protein Har1129_18355 [Haloarcula sp. CBA1129]KAA9400190.1 hypothetical protein Har1130_15560 [Haloarcula sp. CBA1130]
MNENSEHAGFVHSRSSGAIAVIGVLLLVVSTAIVLTTPPATEYEISLYESYPAPFWGCVIGSLFAGSLLIFGSIGNPDERSWVFGTLLMLATDALLLLMPLIRGYVMYGDADPLTHLGYVQDIVNTGTTGANIYPLAHLLVFATADATGLEAMTLAMLTPVFFSAVYFGGMIYLLFQVTDSRQGFLLGLPFVLLPILGYSHLLFRPFDFSILLIPVVLYLFFKSQRHPTPAIRAMLVLTLLSLLLYHPLTAVFVTGIFLLYYVVQYVPQIKTIYRSPTSSFGLSLAIIVSWYSNFPGVILRFDTIYRVLFGTGNSDAPVQAYAQTATEATPALIDIVWFITFRFGTELVLFFLGGGLFGVALLLSVRKRYGLNTRTTVMGAVMGVFGIVGLLFLLLDLIVTQERPWQVAKIGAVLLLGPLFRIFWSRHKQRSQSIARGAKSAVTVTILVLVVLSTLTLYPSPLSGMTNDQVTAMEVEGSQWLTERETGDRELYHFDIEYRRFHHAEHGVSGELPFWEQFLPPHFNYTTNRYFGQNYDTEKYVMINRKGRIFYQKTYPDYPERWKYTSQDFQRFNRDRTVDRSYDNGDIRIYLANGTRAQGA